MKIKRMEQLLIVGAGGHGRVVADAALLCGWQRISFVDDLWPGLKQVNQWPVICAVSELERYLSDADGVIVAIGNNQTRHEILQRLKAFSASIVNVVHPSAVVSPTANIGIGIAILACAVVNPGAEVADGVIINTGAVVEHDCNIGPACHICPSVTLAGGVTIGKSAWIGIGSTVIQNLQIGEATVVGAGAVVVKSLPPKITVVGVPARQLVK